MSKSLHHSFDIDLAAEYGVHEAIIIHHLQHWIRFNRKMGKNLIEGKCWMYQTRKEMAAHFPYLDFNQVRRLLEKLEEEGVIVSKNFNKSPINRTLWYAFIDEKRYGVEEEKEGDKGKELKESLRKANLPNANGSSAKYIKDIDTEKEDTKKEQQAAPKRQPKASAAAASPKKKYDWAKLIEGTGLKDQDVLALLKKFDEDAIYQSLDLYWIRSKNGLIAHKMGWMTKCLQEKWYESVNQEAQEVEERTQKNKKIALALANKYFGKLKPNASIEVFQDEIFFISGQYSSRVRLYSLTFEQEVKKELKRMGIKYD